MPRTTAVLTVAALLCSCVAEPDVFTESDYEEVEAATIMTAPAPRDSRSSPANRDKVDHGRYMVELLGCESCHTDGALAGDPNLERRLAGSRIGIAWSNPVGNERPGVVYPPNITPDPETGIGNWTDQQVQNAVRAGIGRHGDRRISVMPWQGYAKMTDNDVEAISAYLHSIEPIVHRVPREVKPGRAATEPFVYFGVYRQRD